MAMTDPIADMLTQIRNGLKAQKKNVTFPGSKIKTAILNVLLEEGYIKEFVATEENNKPKITVELKYYQGNPVIETIKRVSTPGRRVYYGVGELPSVQQGLGVAIVSTSKGIMNERQARKTGLGGELICTVC